jgi:hypothetical protein
MIIISHRGNLTGSDPDTENKPEQILYCIEKGYDVEIDLWCINNEYFLGHDSPTYKVDLIDFIHKNRFKLWVHCKNIEAFGNLADSGLSINYFWHQEDRYTLTSWDYIWSYPNSYKPYFKNQILLDFSKYVDFDYYRSKDIKGICVDYVE